MFITVLGLAAAALTSLAYIPQVQKALPPGSTADLSVRTLAILAIGLGLWILYGIFQNDWVIILANSVGSVLVGTLLTLKLRDVVRRHDA